MNHENEKSVVNSLIVSATVVGASEIQNLSDPVVTTYYPKQVRLSQFILDLTKYFIIELKS